MKCHDEHERRRAAAPAAAEVKAPQTPSCPMTFSSLSDQDHIMVIILQPAGVSPLHPAGPSPCQHEPSSLHLRSDIGSLSVRKR